MRTLTDLLGETVRGPDGNLGSVTDIWLDDVTWTPRFLIVSPGVLATPLAVPTCHTEPEGLSTHLTGSELGLRSESEGSSPNPTAGLRVRAFAGWSGYWGGPGSLGTGPVAGTGALPALALTPQLGPRHAEGEEPELLSLQRLRGAPVLADSSQFGHLADVVLGHRPWAAEAIVVDTGAILPGEKVLVPISEVLSAGIEKAVVMVRPEALNRAS